MSVSSQSIAIPNNNVAVDGDLQGAHIVPLSNNKKIPKVNISIQNVCSLNISKPCGKTYSKLAAVVKSESDIILLCDTRLNSDVQVAALNDINVKLRFMGYSLFHNSTKNSRGTAILVSKKMSITVEDSYRDPDCNILLLKLRLGTTSLTLGCVYGPNTDDE